MHDARTLLATSCLSVITRGGDAELLRARDRIDHIVEVDGRAELARLFEALLATRCPATPKTLDLIGHSSSAGLLILGDWVIDAAEPSVASWLRELALTNTLPRLAIHGVRLLGCGTAATARGRETITRISEILGVEVHGTRTPTSVAHLDASGFARDYLHLLLGSSELRGKDVAMSRVPYPRVLELDRLPAGPLSFCERSSPVLVASDELARRIWALLRHREGAPMPGAIAPPRCTIAIRRAESDAYVCVDLLQDFLFARVYPDGPGESGIACPVTDPVALELVVDQLPELPG
jgi:hypothetical protein